jgi:hypothetical protein
MTQETTPMTNTLRCPRRDEGGLGARAFPGPDSWREDKTCSFCGSMAPTEFFRVVEAGGEIVPTDKNYKAYVRGPGLRQTFRDCPRDTTCRGPEDCTHWTTRDVSESKFYFQHFDAADRARFIELHNSKRMKIGFPGHFYARPYFCVTAPAAESASGSGGGA